MTNTLILAFLAADWCLSSTCAPWGWIPGSSSARPYMATEAISGIASSIGVILAVRLTALITSLLFGQQETAPLAK